MIYVGGHRYFVGVPMPSTVLDQSPPSRRSGQWVGPAREGYGVPHISGPQVAWDHRAWAPP